MRITVAPLSPPELRIALDILNLEARKRPDDFVKAALRLEENALKYSKLAARAAQLKKRIWRYYFAESEPNDVQIQRMRREWAEASKVLREGIDQRAGWFSLPYLALPSKQTIVAIVYPKDLANWFSCRLTANRQGRFVVKCKLCGQFGIRKRGTAQYCSMRCQKLANTEQTYQAQGADFSEWLLKQPRTIALPPRLQLMRDLSEKDQISLSDR
jgi:hypothetical protein